MINVLCVDDEDAFLELTKTYLEMSGELNVRTASTMEDARAVLTENGIDVIISDYQMPGGNGLQFLQEVRARDQRMPFILFTGRGREEIIIEAYDRGVSFYVQKGGDVKSQFVDLELKVKQAFERRRAENALVESEARFHALVERSPLAIGIVRGGRIDYANPAYMKLLGYDSQEELNDRPLIDHIDPAFRQVHSERVGRQMCGQRVSPTYESVMIRKDGSTVPVLVATVHVVIADDPFTVAFLIDLTERKRDEEALQRSEQMLKVVLDHFPGAIYWKDRNSVYLGANRESARIAGLACPSEFVGKTDHDIPWAGTGAEALREDDRAVMDSGQAKVHVVERQQRSDGTLGWLDTNKVPMRDQEGNVIGLIGASIDITDRKLAEDSLRQVNKQLNLLSEVTRHDMLNQLVVLYGYTDLLEMSDLTARQAEMLKKLRTSINVLKSQLEFTREYQEIGVQLPKWQNLHTLIKEGKRNLALGGLRVEEEGTDVWILADPMLEKVVYNLMENVLRHGGGASLLRITASARDGRLTVAFEDDGKGIDPQDRQHLFTRGYGKNTGFGLFMSREILNITNMSIREASRPGQGARFEIEVPQAAMFRLG
jgi:PAS domain S-box-containing protein